MAVAVSAVLTAFTVPILNVLAVIALTMYVGDDAKKPTARDTLLRIVKNPMIDGILLGMLCVALRTAQQALFGKVVFSVRQSVPFLYTAISQVAAITSPLALLILGGQFIFTASGKMLRQIADGNPVADRGGSAAGHWRRILIDPGGGAFLRTPGVSRPHRGFQYTGGGFLPDHGGGNEQRFPVGRSVGGVDPHRLRCHHFRHRLYSHVRRPFGFVNYRLWT